MPSRFSVNDLLTLWQPSNATSRVAKPHATYEHLTTYESLFYGKFPLGNHMGALASTPLVGEQATDQMPTKPGLSRKALFKCLRNCVRRRDREVCANCSKFSLRGRAVPSSGPKKAAVSGGTVLAHPSSRSVVNSVSSNLSAISKDASEHYKSLGNRRQLHMCQVACIQQREGSIRHSEQDASELGKSARLVR
jgi:hypothetical protein